MAFNKAKFGKKNPTGDKAFNAITKNVFGGQGDGDDAGAGGDEAPAGPPPKAAKLSGGKSMGKGGGKKYDTATNSFKRC